MLNLYSVFLKKIRKRALLNLLVVFGMLVIGILREAIPVIKDLPTQISNASLIVVIAVGAVFFILSACSFYEFLAQHFLFRQDVLTLFPISYISYVCFWAIFFGFYYVFKLGFYIIPFTPSQWDYEVITASIGLALLTTSGFSLLNTKSFLPSLQEENTKAIKQFRKAHSAFINAISNQRRTATANPNELQKKHQLKVCKPLDEMKAALQNIISTEEASKVCTRYEKLLEIAQRLTDVDDGIAKMELIHYINLLRRDPIPTLIQYNHLLDSIYDVSAFYAGGTP